MAQPRGRPFQPGNTAGRGRPAGSRNKVRLAAQELLSEYSEPIVKKWFAMVGQGNSTALRLAIERILPTRKTVHFRLPKIQSLADLRAAGQAVLQALAKGQLTAEEGDAILKMLNSYRELLESTDLEPRLQALERRQDRTT